MMAVIMKRSPESGAGTTLPSLTVAVMTVAFG
jgi:hypothetical protein